MPAVYKFLFFIVIYLFLGSAGAKTTLDLVNDVKKITKQLYTESKDVGQDTVGNSPFTVQAKVKFQLQISKKQLVKYQALGQECSEKFQSFLASFEDDFNFKLWIKNDTTSYRGVLGIYSSFTRSGKKSVYIDHETGDIMKVELENRKRICSNAKMRLLDAQEEERKRKRYEDKDL